MKVSKIVSQVKKQINKSKFIREEKEISKYVTIHDIDTYGDSFNQMYTARSGIAKYAKEKGVRIDIFDAAPKAKENAENNLSDKLNVVVSNILTGKKTERFVSANTDKVTTKMRQRPILIPVKHEEDLQIVRNSVHYTDDTFLRNLYRNIEEMTHSILNARHAKNK